MLGPKPNIRKVFKLVEVILKFLECRMLVFVHEFCSATSTNWYFT